MHLPLKATRMSLGGQDEFVEAYRSLFTYSHDPVMLARTTNYERLVTIELFNNITPGASTLAYEAIRRTRFSYNAFGNIVAVASLLPRL